MLLLSVFAAVFVFDSATMLCTLTEKKKKHHEPPPLPELLLHPHTGPGSSSITVDPGSESTSEMMCGGSGGGGGGGMTSSFTWLESVNSTMDEIKTLIVNQEVWRVSHIPPRSSYARSTSISYSPCATRSRTCCYSSSRMYPPRKERVLDCTRQNTALNIYQHASNQPFTPLPNLHPPSYFS